MIHAAPNPGDPTPRFVLPAFIALMLAITALTLVTAPPQSFDLPASTDTAVKL